MCTQTCTLKMLVASLMAHAPVRPDEKPPVCGAVNAPVRSGDAAL